MPARKTQRDGDSPKPARGGTGEPEREAFLGILRTAELLDWELGQILKERGLSGPLYNVLRILRGAGSEGLPCSEIAARMLNRDPDITRLVDRLERRRLVRRVRGPDDRRVVRVASTEAGLTLLSELDEPVTALHKHQLGHVGKRRLDELVALLEVARRR